jgi:Tol biopolymer transport system component
MTNSAPVFTPSVTRVSTSATGAQADDQSYQPVLSADGTKVAFESYADNLVPGDTNGAPDIFVKDLTTGAITLVSTNASGVQGDSWSYQPVFSPDGTKLAFSSASDNLVPGDTNQAWDVFVKDLTTGAVTRVSTSASRAQADGFQSSNPIFSPDGTKVAF